MALSPFFVPGQALCTSFSLHQQGAFVLHSRATIGIVSVVADLKTSFIHLTSQCLALIRQYLHGDMSLLCSLSCPLSHFSLHWQGALTSHLHGDHRPCRRLLSLGGCPLYINPFDVGPPSRMSLSHRVHACVIGLIALLPGIFHRHPSSYTSDTLHFPVHVYIRQPSAMVSSHQVSATPSSRRKSTTSTSGQTASASDRIAVAYVLPEVRTGRPEAWVTARCPSGVVTNSNGQPLTAYQMQNVKDSLNSLVWLQNRASDVSMSHKNWVKLVKQDVPSDEPGFMGAFVKFVDDNRFAEVTAEQGYTIQSPQEACDMMDKQLQDHYSRLATEEASKNSAT